MPTTPAPVADAGRRGIGWCGRGRGRSGSGEILLMGSVSFASCEALARVRHAFRGVGQWAGASRTRGVKLRSPTLGGGRDDPSPRAGVVALTTMVAVVLPFAQVVGPAIGDR
ncbi:hypothetical protein Slala01_68050 [Streptomyces lavendulae subsp. lavendulae]|nr:hypothetical protein Slala01_68050 [Streptomyces lavendulae subsp. lavendulae]